MGLWFAYHDAHEEFAVSLGYSHTQARTPAEPSDIVPAGSLTKVFTAAAVMQLVEEGKVGLDDPLHSHADPFLLALNGTTMERIWGPGILNVTVRMALGMVTGIHEYDVEVNLRATLYDPDWDITPQDFLALENRTLTCAAGSCPTAYVSINYELLGCVLARHALLPEVVPAGATVSWEDYDQRAVLARGSRAYRETLFFQRGRCERYSRPDRTIAHYYWAETANGTLVDQVDLFDRSCLNGWGFGNIGSSARDAAAFFYDLLGKPALISGASAVDMQQWSQTPMWHGDQFDTWYGLGLMKTNVLGLDFEQGNEAFRYYLGHYGDDYGTNTHTGWHPTLQASVSIMLNKAIGDQGLDTHGFFCLVWRAVFRAAAKAGRTALVPGGASTFNCTLKYPVAPKARAVVV